MNAILDEDKLCILISKTPHFTLSEECEKEYSTRSGMRSNTDSRLTVPFSYSPDQIPSNCTNIRSDAVLVCLYREKGSEWCSGPNSQLCLEIVPGYFSEYVDICVRDGQEVLTVNYIHALQMRLQTFKEETAKLAYPVDYSTINIFLSSYEFDTLYTLKQSRLITPYKEHALKLDKEWVDVRKRQLEKDHELLNKEQPWETVTNRKKKSNQIIYMPTTPIQKQENDVNSLQMLMEDSLDISEHQTHQKHQTHTKSAFSIPPINSIARNRFYLDDDTIEEFT